MNSGKPDQKKNTSLWNRGHFAISGDMVVILFWTLLCIAIIFFPGINNTFLRVILALPVILFIPGYILIAALFPDTADIDTIERIILSIGASIIIAPLIGLCLNFTPWGIRLEPVLVGLAGFIIIMLIVAMWRRSSLALEARYSLPIPEILAYIRSECNPVHQSPKDRVLFVGCVLAICFVIISSIIVVTTPKAGEKFTEFYLLGENQTADSYPDQIVPETHYTVFIGINNHEYQKLNYTVEIYLTSIPANLSGDDESWLGPHTLENYTVTLNHNETSLLPVSFSVPTAGKYRLDLLLFNETVPNSDISGISREDISYRNLHLWINATLPITLGNTS